MKVEKIDLKKTILELPSNTRIKDFIVIKKNSLPTQVETYEVVKVMVSNNIKNYLVKRNDKQLLQDLLIITQTQIDNIVYARTEEIRSDLNNLHITLGRDNAVGRSIINELKNRNLWQRILNK